MSTEKEFENHCIRCGAELENDDYPESDWDLLCPDCLDDAGLEIGRDFNATFGLSPWHCPVRMWLRVLPYKGRTNK